MFVFFSLSFFFLPQSHRLYFEITLLLFLLVFIVPLCFVSLSLPVCPFIVSPFISPISVYPSYCSYPLSFLPDPSLPSLRLPFQPCLLFPALVFSSLSLYPPSSLLSFPSRRWWPFACSSTALSLPAPSANFHKTGCSSNIQAWLKRSPQINVD